MSTSTSHDKLRIALADLTGSVAVIEAAFTPWDDDQRAALEGLLTEMTSLEDLDAAVFDAAA